MDRATVIVALPPVDDRVTKVSSEKVPHLTLLYLGDAQLSSEAILYVQHACAELSPFGLSVDYRGTLGADEADVLFFEKKWDGDRVSDFRHYLLLNDEIKRAYESADQFPEWTPHLTLGYPEAPAHDDNEEDRRIHYVDFDRIAVWTGDFEGPEFRLKYDDIYPSEVSMSDMTTAERGASAVKALFHSGVKGMKWGVRKDEGHQGERVKTKKLDKLDQKWEADMSRNAYMKLYNAAADKMNNGGIDKINNSPKYKDVDLTKPENSKLLDEYYNDHETAFQQAMVEAGPSLGMNPSGTKQFVIKKVETPDGESYDDVFLEPVGLDLKHDEVSKAVAYRLNRDDMGFVTDYEQVELELKHYGVKGMRWGVTKVDRATQPTLQREKQTHFLNSKEVTVTQRRAGTFVKTKGGQRQKASDDAVKAHAGRQKAKKSTTDALTNDELKAVVERLRLEQEYAKLDSKVKRKGQNFVTKLLQSPEGRKTTEDLARRIAEANNQ